MSNEVNLGNIANSVRDAMESGSFKPSDHPEPEEIAEDVYTPPAGASVHIGARPTQVPKSDPKIAPSAAPVMPEGVDLGVSVTKPVAMGDVFINGIPMSEFDEFKTNIPDEEFAKIVNNVRNAAVSYRKARMLEGFSPEEATTATTAYAKREFKRATEEYITEHVNTVEVVIDKRQTEEVVPQFTPEERAKMAKANTIKLVVIENKSLESVRVKKVDVKHKAEYLATLQGGLSKYSVPMPATGDYFTFRGAQIMQLASIISTEGENLSEALMRKAQLLYDKFVGGSIVKKNDRQGRTVLAFEDFCNEVAYNDVDIGLFGILCAGQMESSDTELTCRKCGRQWKHNYNVKTLMSQEGFSDYYKERTEHILANSANISDLAQIHDLTTAIRYKSPFTGNMYDLEIPTIAKANRIFMAVDPNDQLRVYHSAIAIYLNRIFVHVDGEEDYLEIGSTDEEIPMLLDTLGLVRDEDNKMLLDEINSRFIYTPKFTMDVVCPGCGQKTTLDLSIDQLVFQKAQDTYTVTP